MAEKQIPEARSVFMYHVSCMYHVNHIVKYAANRFHISTGISVRFVKLPCIIVLRGNVLYKVLFGSVLSSANWITLLNGPGWLLLQE